MGASIVLDILRDPEIAAILRASERGDRPAPLPPDLTLPPQPAAPVAVPAGEQRTPGFWGRFRQALPRMIQGGITAAATPAQFGGGAVDLFRGMQAAQNELDRRDLMAYQIAQQQQEEARRQRAAEAQARAHEAQARYYDKRAQGQQQPVTLEQALTAAYLEETDPQRKTEIYNQILQLKGRSTGNEAPYREIGGGYAITKSGQRVEIDPRAAMAHRLEVIRQMQMSQPDPQTGQRPVELSDTDVLARMTPEQQAFYVTGEWAVPGGGRAMTEWQARFLAAQGDPIAQAMLNQRAQEEAAERAQAEARARRAQKRIAEQIYLDDLARAEAWFAGEKAKLDKTMRPGQGVNPATGLPLPEDDSQAWERYNEAHRALVEQLAQRKNQAHVKAQAAYAAIDPENFRPSPGYGPDAMPLGRITDPTAADYLKRRGLR